MRHMATRCSSSGCLRLVWLHSYYKPTLFCSCDGIRPGWVESISPMESNAYQIEASQAQWSCASSFEMFTQPFLHRAQPKARGPDWSFRASLSVVAPVISWPTACFRHEPVGVSRRMSLISSPLGSFAEPTLDELRRYSNETEAAPQFHRCYLFSAPHVLNAADTVIVKDRRRPFVSQP